MYCCLTALFSCELAEVAIFLDPERLQRVKTMSFRLSVTTFKTREAAVQFTQKYLTQLHVIKKKKKEKKSPISPLLDTMFIKLTNAFKNHQHQLFAREGKPRA